MSDTDPLESQRLLGERFERLEKRLLPFLEPLVKDALHRGVCPPRYDGNLEEIQNVLFMIPKDDPILQEVKDYEKQKAAGRTTIAYDPAQILSLAKPWTESAASLLTGVLQNAYLNRIVCIRAPGSMTWGDGRVITAPHLRFYRDAACIDGDMLPIGLDVREIDDFFWHTVLTADDVRSALRAYKASLPPGTVIDEDFALVLDDFLADVEEAEQDKNTGP